MLVAVLVRPVGLATMLDSFNKSCSKRPFLVYRTVHHLVPQYNEHKGTIQTP